jgi:hypothetical protein
MAMPPQVPAEAPSHWLVYFAVADIDRAVAATAKLGGAVAQPPMDIEPGRFAILEDPRGAVFAVCEPVNPAADR